jgi:hypothetical protein
MTNKERTSILRFVLNGYVFLKGFRALNCCSLWQFMLGSHFLCHQGSYDWRGQMFQPGGNVQSSACQALERNMIFRECKKIAYINLVTALCSSHAKGKWVMYSQRECYFHVL